MSDDNGRMKMEVVCDCVTMPPGYKCFDESNEPQYVGLAITLASRATHIPVQQQERFIEALKTPSADIVGAMPPGLLLWQSAITGLTLFAFDEDGKPVGDKRGVMVAIDRGLGEPQAALFGSDSEQLRSDCARSASGSDAYELARSLMKRLEANFAEFMRELASGWELRAAEGADAAFALPAAWFGVGGLDVDVDERTNVPATNDAPPLREGQLARKHWRFPGFCLEVGRTYPLNTAAHLGFVLGIPKTAVADWIETIEPVPRNLKPKMIRWKPSLRIAAIPWFGRAEGSTTGPSSSLLTGSKIGMPTLSTDTFELTAECESPPDQIGDPPVPHPTVVIRSPARLVGVTDDRAIIDMDSLFVRLRDEDRVTDGAWTSNVEHGVYRAFSLAEHIATHWDGLLADPTSVDPEGPIALLRDWCSLLRDLTGLGAWRESEACFINDLKFEVDEELLVSDARSRYHNLVPEWVLRNMLLPKPGANEPDEQAISHEKIARSALINRNSQMLNSSYITLFSWASVLRDALHEAGRGNALSDALPVLVGVEGKKKLEELEKGRPAFLKQSMAAILWSLGNDEVVAKVIAAEWFAAEDNKEIKAKVLPSLEAAIQAVRDRGPDEGLSYWARRSLAAPFWDRAIDLISGEDAKEDRRDDIAKRASWLAWQSMLLRRADEKPIDRIGPVEATLAGPRLTVLGSQNTPPKWFKTAVNEAMSKAKPSTDVELRPPSDLPRGIALQVDRLSSSKPVEGTNTKEDLDYARLLSGFGVLVGDAEQNLWSCANMARYAVNEVEFPQGKDVVFGSIENTNQARAKLGRRRRDNASLVSERVHPLRLGFVNGQRQVTLTYQGQSLLGLAEQPSWIEDLPPENPSAIARQGSPVPAWFVSPLFWYSPVLPQANDETCELTRLRALHYGQTYTFAAFALLNAGVLPPALASASHPCEMNGTASPPDAFKIDTGYKRNIAIGSPDIVAKMQPDNQARNRAAGAFDKGVFGASQPNAVYVRASDRSKDLKDPTGTARFGRLVARASGVQVGLLSLRLPPLEMHREHDSSRVGKPAIAWNDCEVVVDVKLGEQQRAKVIIGRKAEANGFLWSVDGTSCEEIAPFDADVRLVMKIEIARPPVPQCVVTWDDVAEYSGSNDARRAVALERVGKSQFRGWVSKATRLANTKCEGSQLPPELHAESVVDVEVRVRPSGRSTETMIALPQLWIDKQGPVDPPLNVLAVPVGEQTLRIEPPRTSVANWLRCQVPLGKVAAEDCAKHRTARTKVLCLDLMMRKWQRTQGEAGQSSTGIATLDIADPVVTHVVLEIVPLFRPTGQQTLPQRVLVDLREATLQTVISDASTRFPDRRAEIEDGEEWKTAATLPVSRSGFELAVAREVGVASGFQDAGHKLVVGAGEVIELRAYPAMLQADFRCDQVVIDALHSMTVVDGQEPVLVGEASSVRLEAAPTLAQLKEHTPTKEELFSCLRVEVEDGRLESSRDTRELVAVLDVPSRMVRRFAYVASIEARRQQWQWRGEVFPREPLTNPWPQENALTAWGDQSFVDNDIGSKTCSPLERWEAAASAWHPESSFESRDQVYPWACTRLELLRYSCDHRGSLHRLAASAVSIEAIGSGGRSSIEIEAGVDADATEPNKLIADLWRNAGMQSPGSSNENRPEPRKIELRWKRIFIKAKISGRLAAPKVWMILPMSRSARRLLQAKQSSDLSITSAIVLTIGGGYDHAGWGEDIECQVSSVRDEVRVPQSAELKPTQWKQYDVGSVPGSTSKPFPLAFASPPDAHRPPRCVVTAGPVGHSFDPPDALDPLISASSYMIDLAGMEGSWLKLPGMTTFEAALDARVMVRRVLMSGAAPGNTLEDHASEWSVPLLVRCGVDSSGLAEALRLQEASISMGDKGPALRFEPSAALGHVINNARKANYMLWVLITQSLVGSTTDTEEFFGIAPLFARTSQSVIEYPLCTAGHVVKADGWQPVARVLLVQADLSEGGQSHFMNESWQPTSLTQLASILMPGNAEMYERDPWNRPEALARIVSVSEPCALLA